VDHVGVFPLKLVSGHEMGLDDLVPDIVKVFWSLSELTGLEHYEFGGGHCGLWRNHVGGFRDVEWQKGLNPVGYIIHGMPEGLVSSDPLHPEDGVHNGWPFSFFSVAPFIIASQMSRWWHSTILFACELYSEMQM
jgi:hypothetical protein